MTEKEPWTTRDELRFIDSLGTHSLSPRLTVKGRAELLMKYIEALSLRSEWGDINQEAVRAHAATRLRNLVNQ